MKWRPAKLNTRASALTLIVLVSVACGYSLFTYQGYLKHVREVRLQFGFYDLKFYQGVSIKLYYNSHTLYGHL